MAKSSQFAKIVLPFAGGKKSVLSARWSGLSRGEFIFIGYVTVTWIGFEIVIYYM